MIDSPTSPATAPVRALRPHPAAWRTALHLADGDRRRLEVLDASTVLVRNTHRR